MSKRCKRRYAVNNPQEEVKHPVVRPGTPACKEVIFRSSVKFQFSCCNLRGSPEWVNTEAEWSFHRGSEEGMGGEK